MKPNWTAALWSLRYLSSTCQEHSYSIAFFCFTDCNIEWNCRLHSHAANKDLYFEHFCAASRAPFASEMRRQEGRANKREKPFFRNKYMGVKQKESTPSKFSLPPSCLHSVCLLLTEEKKNQNLAVGALQLVSFIFCLQIIFTRKYCK